jgi:spermidine synthase
MGVYAFSLIKFLKNPKKLVLINALLFIFFSFLSFVFIRNIRNFLHISIGGDISLKSTVLFMFAALSSINFLEGISVGSIIQLIKNAESYSLKKLVKYIGAGSILGCLLYSSFLFQILGIKILLLAYSLLILGLLTLVRAKKNIIIILLPFSLFFSLLFSDTVAKFDKYLLNRNFPDTTIEEYKYSSYGQVVLLQRNNEYYLLSNNLLLFSSPDSEILHSEDFGHIPILHHQDPKNILVIGGATKYLPMVFEHKVDTIDYVEADASVIESIKNNFSHLGYVFNDKRLNIYNTNAENFIKQSKLKYDLILIGLPAPINLYLNSYYTKEFFALAKNSLASSGFLALTLPGKKVFLPFITSELNASVFEALRQNFNFVRAIPGKQNILIASQDKIPYRLYIKQRLYKIKESAIVLSKRYIDDKMDTEKTNWLMDDLDRTTQEENLLNTRNNPQAAMFALLYKQSEFSPYLSILLDKIARFSYLIVLCVIGVFFLSKSIYKTTSFTCGATASWINFTAVFTLQSYNGQILSKIGIILAIFMLGIISGNILSSNLKKHTPLNKKSFFAELSFLLITIIWFLVLKFGGDNPIAIYILLLATGVNSGIEFSYLMNISNLYHNKIESKLKIFCTEH